MQTERVTFLTTPDHKAALDAIAVSNGQSVGHVDPRGLTSQYIGQPTEAEDAELAMLVQQANEAIPKIAWFALIRMIAALDASHSKVDAFLREAGVRR